MMITFVLSGLWHGASWNFALWGAYHGLLLILYRGLERVTPKLLTSRSLLAPRVLLLFGLTNLGWLMFRERQPSQLWFYLTLSPAASTAEQWAAAGYFLGLICSYALPLVVHTAVHLLGRGRLFRSGWSGALAQGATAAALLLGMMLLYSTVPSDFIYFQF